VSAEGLLLAGRVGAPHGLDGSFLVSQPEPDLLRVGMLDSGQIVTIDGRAYAINRRAGHDTRVILRLVGVSDRDAALALRGKDLFVERSRAPALGEDEWWTEDLEGCAVRDGDRPVGVVAHLLAYPSCEVLEVERPGHAAALLVPLVSDAVRSVDIAAQVIDIDLAFLGEA
jgi:16S rRNA processing protein RimM